MSNSSPLISALNGIIGEPNVMQNPDRLKVYAVDLAGNSQAKVGKAKLTVW